MGHGYFVFKGTQLSELSLLSLAAASSFQPITLPTAPLLIRFIYTSHWSLTPLPSYPLLSTHFWKYSRFQPRTCHPSPCSCWFSLCFFSGLHWNQDFHVQLTLLASCQCHYTMSHPRTWTRFRLKPFSWAQNIYVLEIKWYDCGKPSSSYGTMVNCRKIASHWYIYIVPLMA